MNTIQFYSVEPLWGSPVEMGYVFPGLHLRFIRGYSNYAPTGHAFDVRNNEYPIFNIDYHGK
ncbi:MAG: hypothetical protein GX792_11385 [Bacteroidales bacterium]|nr:hypothetical protein [Bacteroidales bacterium]